MDWKEVFKKIEAAVIEVENKNPLGNGGFKRDTACTIINGLIDIPFVPEWVEDRVIVLLVDFIVDLFNRKFGKRWIETLPKDKL